MQAIVFTDRIGPIDLVFEDPYGEEWRLAGHVEPPQSRRWEPSDNEFLIREGPQQSRDGLPDIEFGPCELNWAR